MSASAPTPGVGKQVESRAAAGRTLHVRLRDHQFTIAANNIGIRIKDRFMGETGRAVEWYLAPERAASGDVALCGLWFISRLNGGEAITWEQILDEWEAANFEQGDIDVRVDDGLGDDPEV